MDVSITTTKFSFPKYYGIFLLEMTFIHLLIQGLTKADVANRYYKGKKKMLAAYHNMFFQLS